MALYIGTNYHPHDWGKERWKKDVELMAQVGFTTVRLGHLCWDSYEPEEGVYTFEWFDEVMDLFAQVKIGVVLDISMRPAPVWVHKLCPGCDIYSQGNVCQPSIRRYMEDVEDPAYQYYALRFAEVLAKRYKDHPALFAFGLCNEIGDGYRSRSEYTRKRFANWLKRKYGTVDSLNTAWAARRWSRKLTSFDDVILPENDWVKGSPEAWLDMRRFYSDANGKFMVKLARTVEACAPGIPHSSNHYAEKENLGFDYMKYYDSFVDYPGMGFYPGYQAGDQYQFLNSVHYQRLAETQKPMWCLEFQTGSKGIMHGPYGALRMHAMLCLLNRTQMILGWTWRSMLGGEEQYLYGLLSHDGVPTVNYREYGQIAAYMKKLEQYAFPYLPLPEVAVSYDYDSDWVIQYSPAQFRMSYKQNMTEVQRVFFDRNQDMNVVDLNNIRGNYKVLIIPGQVCMSREEAETVRQFVSRGGCVIMTACSATVDEHGQVFSTPRPGYLEDVFGIRIAGFARTDEEWSFSADLDIVRDEKGRHERLRVGQREPFVIDVLYYEELELVTAEEYAEFPDKNLCAVSVNTYGKGKAYYLAAETNADMLKWILERLTPELGLKRGIKVPEGIQARRIAPEQYFFVNTTADEIIIPLTCMNEAGRPETATKYGVLQECCYEDSLPLKPYDAELVIYR